MAQYHLNIPDDRIELRGCRAARPLEFRLSTCFSELFTPANEERTDLCLALGIRPAEDASPRRAWTVPFKAGIRLEAERLRRNKRKLKAPNLAALVAEEGSVRRAIERFALDWIGPNTRVRVFHFPKGHMDPRSHGGFRVEILFLNEVIAQWNGSHEMVNPFEFFTDLKSPL